MNQAQTNFDEVKVLNPEMPGVEKQYLEFFVPNPPPVWRQDDDDVSLDQPSPLKTVPSETTYGIESIVSRNFNGQLE